MSDHEEREGIDAMDGGLEFLWRGVKHDDAETGGLKEEICLAATSSLDPAHFFFSVRGTRGAKSKGTKLSLARRVDLDLFADRCVLLQTDVSAGAYITAYTPGV